MPGESSLYASEAAKTATDLIAAFAGEDARIHDPIFRYSEESRIVRIELHAVGNEATTAQYSGREAAYREVNNILRITTADGMEGVSGVDSYYQGPFSDEHLQELRGVAAELAALDSLDPVEVGIRLRRSRPGLSDAARASIDIALWDLAARRAGLPLYQLLGAKRDAIEAYASLPFYESLAEHVDAVRQYAKLDIRTFKFHVWGSIEEDLRLVTLVQQTFADSPYRFMIDLEGAYDLNDALRLGQQMDRGQFIVLEGPIDDERLTQYAILRDRLAVNVIPAGYNIYSPDYLRQAIDAESWDAGRFDVTVVGGISPALELMIIANEAEVPIEVQSWGHSLAQAVNLHLMLANERTPYFEAPMPKDAFEFGMVNGSLLADGKALPPDGPGLGIVVDWDSLAAADFHVHVAVDFSRSPE